MKIEISFKELGFEGTASVDIPGFNERVDILKGLNIAAKDGKVVDVDPLDYSIKVNNLVKERTSKVSLVHGPVTFNSVEDLEFYKKGMEVINKLATVILNGIELGE